MIEKKVVGDGIGVRVPSFEMSLKRWFVWGVAE
jgi:hypothetical protein